VIKKYSKPTPHIFKERTLNWIQKATRKQKILCKKIKGSTKELSCCPICQSLDIKAFHKVFSFSYFICESCNHLFLKDIPDEDAIHRLYSGEANQDVANQAHIYADDQSWKDRVEYISKPKLNFIIDVIKTIDSSEISLLDIGCGGGEILKACCDRNIKSLGIDSDKELISFCVSKKLDAVCTYVDDNISHIVKRKNKQINCVSLINVLEHIENPTNFLQLLSLVENEYFVFEVPLHPSLSTIINILSEELTYRHVYPPDHLHIFTKESISHMLNKIGFKEIACWYFGQDFSFLNSFLKHNLVAKSKDAYFSIFFDLCDNLQKSLDEKEFSDTAFVIAKKV